MFPVGAVDCAAQVANRQLMAMSFTPPSLINTHILLARIAEGIHPLDISVLVATITAQSAVVVGGRSRRRAYRLGNVLIVTSHSENLYEARHDFPCCELRLGRGKYRSPRIRQIPDATYTREAVAMAAPKPDFWAIR